MKFIPVLSLILLLSSCHFLGKSSKPNQCNSSKFDFNIEAIDEEGKYLENNNRSFLHYEFCIAQNSECIKEIKRINPNLKPLKSSALLKCGKQSIILSGTTYQDANPKLTLCQLAALDCIKSITKTPFE